MAQTTFKGQPITLMGHLPAVGSKVPDFLLVRSDLSNVSLSDFLGKKIVISMFPSVDTSVCALAFKRFQTLLSGKPNIQLLNVSMDLPFALGRFCSAESLPAAETLSAFRSSFGTDYGVDIASGPLEKLLSRALLVVDEKGIVIYSEQVPEITQEPNYEQVAKALGLPLPASN
jgi:thiol peroxidase